MTRTAARAQWRAISVSSGPRRVTRAVRARCRRSQERGPAVVVEQIDAAAVDAHHVDRLVPRILDYLHQRRICLGRAGDIAGTRRMPGESFQAQPDGGGTLFHDRWCRLWIVPPTLLGSGHAEIAYEKQATDFLCLLLDMANMRVPPIVEVPNSMIVVATNILIDGLLKAAAARLLLGTEDATGWRRRFRSTGLSVDAIVASLHSVIPLEHE